jgi:protein SCO1
MACQWQIPSVLMALVFVAGASAANLTRTADHDYDPPAPGSYALPVIKQATGGEVLDAQGRTVQLDSLVRDRVTVLSFIYSRCADPSACPYATNVLADC